MMIISLCACGLFAWTGKNTTNVYAVDATAETTDCFYMHKAENEIYVNNQEVVGTVSGLGQFEVGDETASISATAKSNYQLVGWQITYKDQSNKTEYVYANNLDANNSKVLVMKDKDNTREIKATITFTKATGNPTVNYMSGGTFALEYIFENLTIRPIFDHLYYHVDATELLHITNLQNEAMTTGDAVYFGTKTEGTETVYSNAYVYNTSMNKFYYYDELHYDVANDNYYTIHQSYAESPFDLKVSYERGAFRLGDEINVQNDVHIVEDKISESVNIDLKGVSIIASSSAELSEYNANNPAEEYFAKTTDELARTSGYEINFVVRANNQQVNVIDITYHNLYVVDVDIKIDGTLLDDNSVIVGSLTQNNFELIGSVSFYYFYHVVDVDKLQFFVKPKTNNSNRTFNIACAETIGKTIDGVTYNYYNFESINGIDNSNLSFEFVESNQNVVVDYSSVKYDVTFKALEYVKDTQNNKTLTDFGGNALSTVSLKRGEPLNLDASSVENVENLGYKFVGYTNSTTNTNLTSTYTFAVDIEKPSGTTIYLCYEKKEFSIEFKNYNSVNFNSLSAINSVTFTVNQGVTSETESFTTPQLVGESVTLTSKIKLGGSVTIANRINSGFKVLGYSLKNTISGEEDYLKKELTDGTKIAGFDFSQAFIETNNIEDVITIYVHLEVAGYTLTYITNRAEDSNFETDVVMAKISAEFPVPLTAVVTRYIINASGEYEAVANDDTTSKIEKIVITGLRYSDQVYLKSEGFSANHEGVVYAYSFNNFTEDGRTNLTYAVSENVYTYTETISKDKTIYVSYSMPSARVQFALNNEYAGNANFSYDVEVVDKRTSTTLQPDDNGVYNEVQVGDVLVITVSNIANGYNFVGYRIEGSATIEDDKNPFELEIKKDGNNVIILEFSQIKYKFVFAEFGANKNGETSSYELTVDNRLVEITKPEGYYVGSVKFADDIEFAPYLCEDNSYRADASNLIYQFELDRADFINAVENYKTTITVDNEEINVVNVKLNYVIYTYEIQLTYALSNPKGNATDNLVQFPSIRVDCITTSETFSITKLYQSQVVVVTGIPYAADVTIRALSGAQIGLEVAGWFVGENLITQDDYLHSSHYIALGNVVNDLSFIYKLTYTSYDVELSYNSDAGAATISINDVLGEKQISLYDKIEIESNPSRNKGYTISSISYYKPIYTIYNHTEETWAELKHKLYVKNGSIYTLNIFETYDANVTYYELGKELVELDPQQLENGFNFLDTSFDVANYTIENQKVRFAVQYRLVEISLNHSHEIEKKFRTFDLNIDGKIAFDDASLYSIASIQAQNKNSGAVRNLGVDDVVTYQDIVTIVININNSALNGVDAQEYDLSLGLTLTQIYIPALDQTKNTYIPTMLSRGVYTFTFMASDHMMVDSDEINIQYTLYLPNKVIEVTSVVTNSTDFYNHYIMSIYNDFNEATRKSKAGDVNLKHERIQFLDQVRLSSEFLGDYKNYFEVYDANVYLDGSLVAKKDYSSYGIVPLDKDDGYADFTLSLRAMYAVKVEFKVKPILKYKNGIPNFSKVFKCDQDGYGIGQTLSVGAGSEFDIQVASDIVSSISITFGALKNETVSNCGTYYATLTFVSDTYSWLNDIALEDNITLTITQKTIYLTYDAQKLQKTSKPYNGKSDVGTSTLMQYLKFTDEDGQFTLDYEKVLAYPSSVNNFRLTSDIFAYITSGGKDNHITNASNDYYNVYIEQIALKSNDFNNNFKLQTTELEVANYIKIDKKELWLTGVLVASKVYDGTTSATLINPENINIQNKIDGDDVVINIEKLLVQFEDAEVGTNKKVKIVSNDALGGQHMNNYFVKDHTVKNLTIYPYGLEVKVAGVGTIRLFNERGLTEQEMVNLIPINAKLEVKPIFADTPEYSSIYKSIANNVKGTNEYAVGYKLIMTVAGNPIEIDKNLYLSVPKVKNLTGVYYLTGSQTAKLDYSSSNGFIVVDLSQMKVDVDGFYLTEKRILLKPWQIVLIVIAGALVITAVVLTIIIVRKRKHKEYSVHEKI